MKMKAATISLVIILITNVASSCPVCYGQTDTNTASAVNVAILVLLSVTGAVLTSIASVIAYLRKKFKMSLNNNINNPS